MCVIELGDKIHKKVIAYKLFGREGRKIVGLYRVAPGADRGYKRGVKYYARTMHGIQAFVRRRDALKARWATERLERVELFNARQGVINGMRSGSDGAPGWSARAMRIPRRAR